MTELYPVAAAIIVPAAKLARQAAASLSTTSHSSRARCVGPDIEGHDNAIRVENILIEGWAFHEPVPAIKRDRWPKIVP